MAAQSIHDVTQTEGDGIQSDVFRREPDGSYALLSGAIAGEIALPPGRRSAGSPDLRWVVIDPEPGAPQLVGPAPANARSVLPADAQVLDVTNDGAVTYLASNAGGELGVYRDGTELSAGVEVVRAAASTAGAAVAIETQDTPIGDPDGAAADVFVRTSGGWQLASPGAPLEATHLAGMSADGSLVVVERDGGLYAFRPASPGTLEPISDTPEDTDERRLIDIAANGSVVLYDDGEDRIFRWTGGAFGQRYSPGGDVLISAARLSGDGSDIAFVTSAALAAGDRADAQDVYLSENGAAPELLTAGATGPVARLLDLSADGSTVIINTGGPNWYDTWTLYRSRSADAPTTPDPPGAGPDGGGSGGGGTGGIGGGGTGGGTTPAIAPKLSGVALTARSVRAGRAISLVFRLDKAATVRIRARRRLPGRRRGTRCVKQTTANKRAKRCVRKVALGGELIVSGHSGPNSIRLNGGLTRSRQFKAGSYELTLTAAVGAKRSPTRIVRLVVLRPRRR